MSETEEHENLDTELVIDLMTCLHRGAQAFVHMHDTEQVHASGFDELEPGAYRHGAALTVEREEGDALYIRLYDGRWFLLKVTEHGRLTPAEVLRDRIEHAQRQEDHHAAMKRLLLDEERSALPPGVRARELRRAHQRKPRRR